VHGSVRRGAARAAGCLGLAQPRLELGNGGRGAVAFLREPRHLPRDDERSWQPKGLNGTTTLRHARAQLAASRSQPLLLLRACEGKPQ
jgi:hypothetical protein